MKSNDFLKFDFNGITVISVVRRIIMNTRSIITRHMKLIARGTCSATKMKNTSYPVHGQDRTLASNCMPQSLQIPERFQLDKSVLRHFIRWESLKDFNSTGIRRNCIKNNLVRIRRTVLISNKNFIASFKDVINLATPSYL